MRACVVVLVCVYMHSIMTLYLSVCLRVCVCMYACMYIGISDMWKELTLGGGRGANIGIGELWEGEGRGERVVPGIPCKVNHWLTGTQIETHIESLSYVYTQMHTHTHTRTHTRTHTCTHARTHLAFRAR